MFYLDSQTNTRYYLGRAFTYGDLQYSSKAATHATFVSLGFDQIVVEAKPDGRFYTVTGPNDSGAYSAVPRDLDELKTSFKENTKRIAHGILRQTDWYVVRLAELGVSTGAIPADVTTYRTSIRTTAGTRCDEIDACTTVQELETLINTNLTEFPELAETYNFGSY